MKIFTPHTHEMIILQTDSIAQAAWKLHCIPEKTLFVVNDQHELIGFLHSNDIPPWSEAQKNKTVQEVYQKNAFFVKNTQDIYKEARHILAEFPSILLVPVIDEANNIIDILHRYQCFYKDYYFEALRTNTPTLFPMPQYAAAIWRGAEIAKSTGYKSMSVIEFGVAQGIGLRACEMHCREISRIFDIGIEVYGFDGGEGLPDSKDWRDVPHCWDKGFFPMNYELLKSKLRSASLVMGNIQQTTKTFFTKHKPAPVGVMLVDVDYYTSTKPILNMFHQGHKHFLPMVSMFFDDIAAELEFQGETLAIKEFNLAQDDIKISPETESFGEYNLGGRRYGFSKLKSCLFFKHPQYNNADFKKKIMNSFWR